MGYVSETRLTVRYSETDQMGIVHHSRYYPWFEVARGDFIKQSGMDYAQMEKEGIWLPLTETHAEYIKGLCYGDEVIVLARLIRLGGVRCEFCYEVYKMPEKKLAARGRTVHAFTDESFKPFNVKKRYPDVWGALSKLVSEENG
ncbi:MAG: acyl-CoA thioesterase [Clostridia bacterium]|nr:acyl-CoA thioesterase [Clostridia bacterium]